MACSLSLPDENASFGVFLGYYTQRAGLSENKLATGARMNQSRLNKISNGVIKDVPVDTLVALCLVLGLNETEARDLLSRKERAFSPANRLHDAYLELIHRYRGREFEHAGVMSLYDALDEADEYLRERGFPTLPDAGRTKEK